MTTEALEKTFFAQMREVAAMYRKKQKLQLIGEVLRLTPPDKCLEMLRLQNPERVRQDWSEPGKPKTHVVIDDGPNSGLTIATCGLEADAAMIVAMWNWMRTLTPKTKKTETIIEKTLGPQDDSVAATAGGY